MRTLGTLNQERLRGNLEGLGDRDGYDLRCWKCKEVGRATRRALDRDTVASRQPRWYGRPESHVGEETEDPLLYLLSDSDSEASVRQIRVMDQGSVHQYAKVVVAGVPMMGAVDTGSDLTTMGGEMFKQVAAAARLHKRDFGPADNYDRKPFRINGRLAWAMPRP